MKTIRQLILVPCLSAALLLLAACSGPAGISVTSANVNSSGHLVLTLTNGQTVDAGNVVGPQGPSGPAGTAASFPTVVPQIETAIVRIDVTVSKGLQSGSGTIIDKRGYIITNAHVVNNQQSIKVTLKDGTSLPATVIGSDTKQDLAVIKLTTPLTNFPTVTLGTMEDVAVGDLFSGMM